jgi:N-acetylmuramoyl-L-alanine amidase
MKRRPSPNFNDRAENIALAYIIVHYTGMRNAAEAFTRLCDPATEVSAHYVIEENGTVTQLIDEGQRAWHAGHSFWRGVRDLNSASIGIELVNPGHEYGYRAFPEAQIAALQNLLPGIITRHEMAPATCLLAHSDIAPTRKKDPGELFPWPHLAQQGFGLWPEPDGSDFESAHASDAPDLLTAIGYDVSNLPAAIRAFQRRYHPENLSGIAGPHTIARLRALNRILPPRQF